MWVYVCVFVCVLGFSCSFSFLFFFDGYLLMLFFLRVGMDCICKLFAYTNCVDILYAYVLRTCVSLCVVCLCLAVVVCICS